MHKPPQHPLRRALTDELHARPFAPLTAPAQMLHFAFTPEGDDAAERSAAADLAHLNALLAHFGAPPASEIDGRPPNHHEVERAGLRIRWERHTEFVSLTLTSFEATGAPFDPWIAEKLPREWLQSGPGPAICATQIHIEAAPDATAAEQASERLILHFDPSSAAQSYVTDREATAIGDFRIDAEGYVRFALIAIGDVGSRRLGRVAQRLLEIETYRAMAMLALPRARALTPRLTAVDRALSEVVGAIAAPDDEAPRGADRDARERATLDRLTELAADLERMKAEAIYRFDAARAYDAIIWERLAALREERMGSRQLLNEFMIRRFRPAMRTCLSTASRLEALSNRITRAATLLRTRIDVSLEAQNKELLASMDRRAALQLRLQETVEGLSVVAISYYAVSLAGYAMEPIGALLGLSAKFVKALLVIPVVFLVWTFLKRLKRRLTSEDEAARK